MRWAAGFAAVLGALSSVLLGVGPAVATPSSATAVSIADGGTVNTPGSQWLASCLNSGRTLSVLFVLDVSGSLLDTDPSLFRYEGLRTALTTLATAKPADGSEVTIEAAVAGFGNYWHAPGEVVPWQRINIDSPNALIDTMVTRARDQTVWYQEGTEFQTVVSNATNELNARGGAESCKAIVWFTDGDPNDSVADMCRVGGVVDQMRSSGIVLIGLRLSMPGQPLTSTAMPIMTLGQSGGETCGTVPIPEGWAPGIFLDATDVKRLFASIQNIVEGCTVTGSSVIDPGIRRVRVNIYAGVDAVRFDLPGAISFTAGTTGNSGPFDGITVSSIREDFYVSMELALPQGVGAGKWSVSSTVALQPDQVEYCVFSDLHLALDESTMEHLAAGGVGALTVNVLGPDDAPAELADFEAVTTAASLVGPDGLPRSAEASMNPNGHDIDLLVHTELSDARLDLTVTLTLTTRSGLTLTPLKLETAVVTALNEYFPTVTPRDYLGLGEALREDSTSAAITLVGSAKGPTSVCFDAPVKVSVPPDAANAAPVYAVGCVDLAAGETRTLTVSVSSTVAVEGDGAAEIPIQIHAAPDPSGFEGEAVLGLPVEWRFSNPLNVGVLIWALIGVILASALIPVVAIVWANWVTARYDVTGLSYERIPVIVTADGVRRKDPIPFAPEAIISDLQPAAVRATRSVLLFGQRVTRRFTVDVVTFRSRMHWNPFRRPSFWAEAPEGTLLLSSLPGGTGRPARPNEAAAAAAFNSLAYFIAPLASIPSAGPIEGTVIAFVASAKGMTRDDAKAQGDADIVAAGWWSTLDGNRSDAALYATGAGGAAGPVSDWDSPGGAAGPRTATPEPSDWD